ncbi:MAG: Uma2 family endonuclease [Blastocatellia bacterium]
MSVRKRKPVEEPEEELVEEIDYPESDGQPMAETDIHRRLMINLIEALDEHFAGEADVYVSGNLLFYYVEGDPTKCVAPDVFVVRGVGKHERRTYKLWEEKHAPIIVIEVSSRKTKKEDLKWKKQLYAWFGVSEYFVFDPEYKMKPPLRAHRLRGNEYVEEAVTGGRVMSRELQLELVNTGKTLRLLNPQTGQFLLTPREETAARRQAEERAEQQTARADHAEAELEKLRAELARLKQPAGKKRRKK